MTLSDYTGDEVWESLQALVAEPEDEDQEVPYDGYISELLYHMEDEVVVTPLDAFKVVETWRHNDEQGVIIQAVGSGRNFRVQGYYSSYGDGDEWEYPAIHEVTPEIVVVQRYRSLKTDSIFDHPSKDVTE